MEPAALRSGGVDVEPADPGHAADEDVTRRGAEHGGSRIRPSTARPHSSVRRLLHEVHRGRAGIGGMREQPGDDAIAVGVNSDAPRFPPTSTRPSVWKCNDGTVGFGASRATVVSATVTSSAFAIDGWGYHRSMASARSRVFASTNSGCRPDSFKISRRTSRDRRLGESDHETPFFVPQRQGFQPECRLARDPVERRGLRRGIPIEVHDGHPRLLGERRGQGVVVDYAEADEELTKRCGPAAQLLLGERQREIVLVDERASDQQLADAQRRRRARGLRHRPRINAFGLVCHPDSRCR